MLYEVITPDKIMEKRAAPKSNLHLVLNKVDNR